MSPDFFLEKSAVYGVVSVTAASFFVKELEHGSTPAQRPIFGIGTRLVENSPLKRTCVGSTPIGTTNLYVSVKANIMLNE